MNVRQLFFFFFSHHKNLINNDEHCARTIEDFCNLLWVPGRMLAGSAELWQSIIFSAKTDGFWIDILTSQENTYCPFKHSLLDPLAKQLLSEMYDSRNSLYFVFEYLFVWIGHRQVPKDLNCQKWIWFKSNMEQNRTCSPLPKQLYYFARDWVGACIVKNAMPLYRFAEI